MLSRPWVALRTKPAFSITRRCLVMACRVIGNLAVSLEIESGPSPERRDTRRSRVSSPSAAKTAAESVRSGFAPALRSLGKVRLNQLDDDRPALVVRGKCLRTALERDAIEPRLADDQQDAVRCVLQHELDQRGRLFRVINVLIDGERMPSEREEAFELDAIDGDLEGYSRMLPLRSRHLGIDRRADEDPAHARSGRKRTIEPDAEPLFKLADIGQRIPDPFAWRAQKHLFFNSVCDGHSHVQPPGCSC